MPNIASLKMQNPLAIPTFLAFSTHSIPVRAASGRRVLVWRRAIYLPPEPLPALGVPTQRSQRRRRPVTVGRTAALLLTITVLGTAIVLGIAHVLGPAITLSSIF